MPDISGMLQIYTYVLIGGLLFVAILAALRAVGGDALHHDMGGDVGDSVDAHVEMGHGSEGQVGAYHDSVSQPTADAGTGPGDVKFQGMTMMTVSIFVVSFSAMGILSLYYLVEPYDLNPLASIPISGVISGGLAVGLSYVAFKYFIATAAGSEMSLREVVGMPCEVTVGTSGDALGEVNCRIKGQILSFSARSSDGARINVGDAAVITRMTGNIAVVQKRNSQ